MNEPASPAPKAPPRLAVLVGSLIMSFYGLLVGVATLRRAFTGPVSPEAGPSTLPLLLVCALVMAYAGLAWLVMGYAWVSDRRVHRMWVITGGIAGVLSLLLAADVRLIFVFPAIVMAVYLVVFHLSGAKPPSMERPV